MQGIGAWKERGRVPIGPHAQQHEVEARQAIRRQLEEAAQVALVLARGLGRIGQLGAHTMHLSSAGSRPASSAAPRAVAIVQRMMSGSASWMITPSPTRPAIASTFGP